MAEEIRARIVFDTRGLAGAAGAAGGGGGLPGAAGAAGPGGGGFGYIAKGVFLGNAILGGVKSLIGKLVAASPQLQASINILTKSLMLILRPIGDVIGLVLRPFALAMLKFAIPFYTKWVKSDLFAALLKPKEERTPAEAAKVLASQQAVGAGAGALIGAKIAGPPGAVLGAAAGGALASINEAITGAKLLGTVIKEWLDVLLGKLGIDMDKVRAKLGEVLAFFMFDVPVAIDNFKIQVEETFEALKVWWSETFVPTFQENWETLQTFIQESFFLPVQEGWDKLKLHTDEKFMEPVKKSWTKFKNWISSDVIEPIKKVWGIFVNWIDDNVIGPIQSAWERLVAAATSAIGSAISAVKSFFRFGGNGDDDNNDDNDRQFGGPVAGGRPYLVGEAGAELFVPGRAGTIIPAGGFGGGGRANVIINVNALDAGSIDSTVINKIATEVEIALKRQFEGRTTEAYGV